jgi:hypothetical protein
LWVNARIILAGAAGFVVGVASTVLVVGPLHARPQFGDLPTWLAVIVASVGGYVALRQLRDQQRQFAVEAKRNEKRDKLLESQLAEAAERANSSRRQQAEQVYLKGFPVWTGKEGMAEVGNGSHRPIRDVICRLYLDGRPVLPSGFTVGLRFEPPFSTVNRQLELVTKPASEDDLDLANGRYRNLLAGEAIRASFPAEAQTVGDVTYLVRFTDDAGVRWQLDEDMHLGKPPDEEW